MTLCHDQDLVVVREILTAHREAGVAWDVAWPRAFASVRGTSFEAEAIRTALLATEAGWRSAYRGDAVWGGPECAALLGVIGEEPRSPHDRPPTALPLPTFSA